MSDCFTYYSELRYIRETSYLLILDLECQSSLLLNRGPEVKVGYIDGLGNLLNQSTDYSVLI